MYWGRPVPGFGDPNARVLILGLAPAAHGANRTGRVFTGDGAGASGDFLMTAMHRHGFASIPTSQSIDDGLTLKDAYIAAAVRCAPPDNKPTPEEIHACRPHLHAELQHLPNVKVVVTLGKIAFDVWWRVMQERGVVMKPRPVFGHGVVCLPFRMNHPVKVAERIAMLDLLSKGRVDFGVGKGGTIQEAGAFQTGMDEIPAMLEESARMIPRM